MKNNGNEMSGNCSHCGLFIMLNVILLETNIIIDRK